MMVTQLGRFIHGIIVSMLLYMLYLCYNFVTVSTAGYCVRCWISEHMQHQVKTYTTSK